jgi:hypothetical protein
MILYSCIYSKERVNFLGLKLEATFDYITEQLGTLKFREVDTKYVKMLYIKDEELLKAEPKRLKVTFEVIK